MVSAGKSSSGATNGFKHDALFEFRLEEHVDVVLERKARCGMAGRCRGGADYRGPPGRLRVGRGVELQGWGCSFWRRWGDVGVVDEGRSHGSIVVAVGKDHVSRAQTAGIVGQDGLCLRLHEKLCGLGEVVDIRLLRLVLVLLWLLWQRRQGRVRVEALLWSIHIRGRSGVRCKEKGLVLHAAGEAEAVARHALVVGVVLEGHLRVVRSKRSELGMS